MYYFDYITAMASQALLAVKHVMLFPSPTIKPIYHNQRDDAFALFPVEIPRSYAHEALVDFKQAATDSYFNHEYRLEQYEIIFADLVEGEQIALTNLQRLYCYYKAVARVTELYKIGTCADLAAWCFFKWLEMGLQYVWFSVEFSCFAHPDLDHTFLILNRNLATDLNDYQTWNTTTIILDLWLGQYYTPQEYFKLWRKNVGVIFNSKNAEKLYFMSRKPSRDFFTSQPSQLSFAVKTHFTLLDFYGLDWTFLNSLHERVWQISSAIPIPMCHHS